MIVSGYFNVVTVLLSNILQVQVPALLAKFTLSSKKYNFIREFWNKYENLQAHSQQKSTASEIGSCQSEFNKLWRSAQSYMELSLQYLKELNMETTIEAKPSNRKKTVWFNRFHVELG